jgi:ABC-type oligopeptide transport system substrate-binding subunit
MELEHPAPYLLDILAFTPWAPVQRKFREEKGADFALTKDDMLYCGPFTLTEYDSAGNTIGLTKNPNYWDAANVNLGGVNFQIISDTQQAVMAYQSGTVDYVELTGDLVNEMSSEEGFKQESGNFIYYLMMNTKRPGLDNENLRIALAYALNRADICDNILKDGSTPAHQMCMVGLFSNEDGTDFASAAPQLYEFDEAKAQEYWEKAQSETDVREFTIVYDQEKDFAASTCAYIQDTVQKTLEGLTINLEATPKKNRIALADARDYDICFWGWGPDYADPTAILAMYESDHPSNYSAWADKEFDKTYNTANTTDAGKPDVRWEELTRCDEIVTSKAVCIPIFQTGSASLTNPKVTGVTAHITGIPCYYKYVTKG